MNHAVSHSLLSGQEAHLWLVTASAARDILDHALLALLSQSEQRHYHSLHIPKVKREYLITRALIRSTLSQYADIAPQDWEFVANYYGRPALAPDFSELKLDFNISHSHGAVACLIAREHKVGLDIESLVSMASFADFCDMVLSTYEQAALNKQQIPASDIGFLHYWTLKEAYSKAMGRGLSINFKEIICVFGSDGVDSLDGFTELSKHSWQLLHVPVLPSHLLAIAIHKATAHDVNIRLMEGIPGFGPVDSGRVLENESEHAFPRLYIT